jgi:uncharacterized membrane-anchored protein
LNLGFLGSVAFFAAAMAVPAVAWWRFGLNPVLAFWAAYVITRPLGASIADWFGKDPSRTGLGAGDGLVSALGLLVFAALVAYTANVKRDIQRPVRREEGLSPQDPPHLGELAFDAHT